jgi:transcriptional regulator with XRE-family HTH domain
MRARAHNPEYSAELRRLAPYEALARIVRGQLRLSQAELVQRVGMSHSAISRIESRRHPTTVQTLRRLAAALKTYLVVGFADKIEKPGEPAGIDLRHVELVVLA